MHPASPPIPTPPRSRPVSVAPYRRYLTSISVPARLQLRRTVSPISASVRPPILPPPPLRRTRTHQRSDGHDDKVLAEPLRANRIMPPVAGMIRWDDLRTVYGRFTDDLRTIYGRFTRRLRRAPLIQVELLVSVSFHGPAAASSSRRAGQCKDTTQRLDSKAAEQRSTS